MKKLYWTLIVILFLIVGWAFVRFVIGGPEDTWIKDNRGVWIKHGNPFGVPEEVLAQQSAVTCALDLYIGKQAENLAFSSQCLGKCEDYSVDIVHVPRTDEDNLVENQCQDYRNRITHSFIELDTYGEIVRIA